MILLRRSLHFYFILFFCVVLFTVELLTNDAPLWVFYKTRSIINISVRFLISQIVVLKPIKSVKHPTQ